MPASKGTYRKADLTNAIRAAIEAGLEVARVQIIPTDHGPRYEIITPRGARSAPVDAEPEHSADEFDDWLPGKGSDDATR
jgi:hypothetical protein